MRVSGASIILGRYLTFWICPGIPKDLCCEIRIQHRKLFVRLQQMHLPHGEMVGQSVVADTTIEARHNIDCQSFSCQSDKQAMITSHHQRACQKSEICGALARFTDLDRA